MNEGKARDAVLRAEKAEALLRNELLTEAFDYLEQQFIQAWRSSGIGEAEDRERIYQLSQNLEALKGYFQTVISDGKMAQSQIDEVKRRSTFNKR
ncbi:hypothetical protein [Marinobacter sp.]|jgi:hypothetical protein|uniref:hypothetical protein n=1 Tax=Marinobacter sp. TaxID=50741 RepID=UPI000C8DFFC3|nr:hypothetical protein [Marinobacter sp.]MAB51348.1 hypothetical protein [Marinobacter sp.]MAB51391.1 hypothetical protein [Marinobacter sp.]|tara:strand:+ start:64 stop:348 length:285 start_codon:yes stop_codon:yes gene_type:complete